MTVEQVRRHFAVALSCLSLVIAIISIIVWKSARKEENGLAALISSQSEGQNVQFKLPILRWHDAKPDLKPLSFYIPPSPSVSYANPAQKADLPFRRKESLQLGHSFASHLRTGHVETVKNKQDVKASRLIALLKTLHVNDLVIKNTMQAVSEKLIRPNVIRKIALDAATANTSSMIIDGGPLEIDGDADVLDMVAVLEGLHVSSQVITDSMQAVQSGLLKPSDIIKIAAAVKEQQVQKFVKAQAEMDRCVFLISFEFWQIPSDFP